MGESGQHFRIRHGLIPVLVALRLAAERKEREEQAALDAEQDKAGKPRKRRRWRWFS
tara:strand:+ start:1441 stop:1611 length:171 start_codon:yes stop_codon:yes gene_type:complete